MSGQPLRGAWGNPYAPDDAAGVEWDAVVIGTGMGGATAGYELARLGRRVLFVEKGMLLHRALSVDENGGYAYDDTLPQSSADQLPDDRLRSGYWPERLRGKTTFGDIEFFAPLGCGSGGSTSLYGAGLERFYPADFEPRANFPNAPDTTLPERWPIGYEDLRPYYERAEHLFAVRGTPDPLHDAGASSLLAPPALSARDEYLLASLQKLGLHPYHAHVGCAYVEGCTGCAPRPCARGCKSDAGRICLLPAVTSFGARLLTLCEAVAIEAGRTSVHKVHCRWNGMDLTLRAKTVVLAAGAYMTPALLFKSRSADWPDGLANRSGLVGRNLMFHVSDFFALVPERGVAAGGAHKTLALNDLYHADGEKLGTFQSVVGSLEIGGIMQFIRDAADRESTWWLRLARSRPGWWRRASSPAVRLVATLMYHLLNYRSAGIWASIIEDLPYHDNRIVGDSTAPNGMRFEYRYTDELRARVESFRRRLARAVAPHRVLLLSRDSNINFGHPCGTCRFGVEPSSSVLDADNRAHDLSNLYVVDASFFPSSGGTNPSLTIAANALRVANKIHARLA